MADFNVKIDDREFQKTFNEYLLWNKRLPSQLINNKLYFISLRAMQETKAVKGETIRADLSVPSKNNAKRTLGEVLTWQYLQAKGKIPKKTKTIVGKIEKFIRRRISHTGFLRSGWFQALKILDFYNRKAGPDSAKFSKKYAPKKPPGVKQLGKPKGTCFPALQNRTVVKGTIQNWVGNGTNNDPKIHKLIQDGLTKAVKHEIASMRVYINDHFNAFKSKLISKSNGSIH